MQSGIFGQFATNKWLFQIDTRAQCGGCEVEKSLGFVVR